MATIDLTLDALKIPALENFTPDFGTKIARTDANKGGLSTREVNSNIMLPWSYMRPKVVTEASTTSLVEYDAKVNFAAALQAGVTLTMGNGDYEGCEVSLRNLSAYSCTVAHGSFSLAIPAGGFVRIIWNGTTWTPDVSTTVGSGILPPTSTAVQAAIAELKDRVVETYQTEQITVTRDTSWELGGSKPGYFPISVEPFNGWSGSVVTSPESIVHSNGSFYIQGFASAVFSASSAFRAEATVVWVKI